VEGHRESKKNLDYNEMLTAHYTSEQERSIEHCRASFSNCLVEQQNTSGRRKMAHEGDTGNVPPKNSWEGPRAKRLLGYVGFCFCSAA
jgi:hypothetical protein